MKHGVYIVQNIQSGKIYVGKSKDPDTRWIKHIRVASGTRNKEKFYIHRAIAKHGKENFTFSVIEYFDDALECRDAEIFYIAYFRSIGAVLYNQTDGGEGVPGRIVSQASREKSRKSQLGKPKHTEEQKIKFGLDTLERLKNPEYKAKMIKPLLENADKLRGTKLSDEKRKQISESTKGIPKSEEHREKLSKLNKIQIVEIRRLFSSGEIKNKAEIARLFNLGASTISRIINRQTWSHI